MKSVMEHQFSQVPRADIPRSSFDRSHGHKTAFDFDWLVPILVDDILPGDSFNVNASFYARLATPLHPILDNMRISTFFFFVPYRLLWDNWEKFHGAQTDPADSIDFTIPAISSGTTVDLTNGTAGDNLLDYFGLPYKSSVDLSEISVLPLRAYNLIWNEWFRDQNLQDSLTVNTTDGPDSLANFNLKKRNKQHDYFTSALPWPQKGTAVDLPLGTSAPVLGIGVDGGSFAFPDRTVNEASGTTASYTSLVQLSTDANVYLEGTADSSGYPTIRADLSAATAATINDIRLAFQTQRLLERDARSGTRYIEMIKAHFGVTSPDYRLQRPEYLGGGVTTVNVTPVAQTSGQPTPATDDALGNLAGFGTAADTHSFTQSFTEHGVLIGLVNASADITYSQGAENYWFKQTRYDWYYPVLANIGEQAIYNREIFYQNTTADDDVFGYQERYAEYRYKPSRLSNLFRVDHASTLASWHLSEDFSTLPTLGDSFIQANAGTPVDRAIAVNTEPHLIADFFFNMRCARPMPLYGVPGMLDHF